MKQINFIFVMGLFSFFIAATSVFSCEKWDIQLINRLPENIFVRVWNNEKQSHEQLRIKPESSKFVDTRLIRNTIAIKGSDWERTLDLIDNSVPSKISMVLPKKSSLPMITMMPEMIVTYEDRQQ